MDYGAVAVLGTESCVGVELLNRAPETGITQCVN